MTTRVALLALLTALGTAACGGDDPASPEGAGGSSGAGGAGGSGGNGGALPEVAGCEATRLLEKPAHVEAGPWPVGALTVDVGGLLTEVWYPAVPGSEAGLAPLEYDIRLNLPDASAALVTDADNPLQPCPGCWSELPLDTERGPYPVVVFIHGTAGFRTQNLETCVHWASRGFIVMAANHPGLDIESLLQFQFNRDLRGNVEAELAALAAAQGPLARFAGHADLGRVGLAGHSAGGTGVGGMGDLPGVQVIVPLAAGPTTAGPALASTTFIGGLADGVVQFTAVEGGYAASSPSKRLVGITGAAHTGVTSLCGIQNDQGEDIVAVASRVGILTGALSGLAAGLFDCADNATPQADALRVVAHASAATLEEVLHCDAGARAALTATPTTFPLVADYREELR